MGIDFEDYIKKTIEMHKRFRLTVDSYSLKDNKHLTSYFSIIFSEIALKQLEEFSQ